MAVTTNTPATLDPNQVKKPPVLPYVAPGANMQMVQPSINPFTPNGQPFNFQAPQVQPQNVQGVSSGWTPSQGFQSVLNTGQQKAQQGFQSPTMDMTSALTQQLLQNPQMGFNPTQEVQRGLEAFDVNRAQSMESARQKLAPTMHGGESRSQFLDLAIQGAQARGQEETALQRQAREESQKNLLGALAEGRNTAESERQRFSTDIGALVDIAGASEGQENRQMTVSENAVDRGLQIALANNDAQLQTNLTELKGKIEQGLLMTQQDFQGVQNDLDRQLEMAIKNGDWKSAYQIEQMKQEFTSMENEAQRTFTSAENAAMRSWQTSERVSEQDFDQAMKWVDYQIAEATAQADVGRQEYLLNVKSQLDLKAQTNAFDHDTKMAYLNAQLEDAKANNDVSRQKDILQFTHAQEMDRIIQEQGFEAGQAYIQQQHEIALQNNDIVAKNALQSAAIAAEASEAALNRNHDILMQQMQQAFDEKNISWATIMGNISNLPADQAAVVLWNEAQKAGVDIGPDPRILSQVNAIRTSDVIAPGQQHDYWMMEANKMGIDQNQAEYLWSYQGNNAVDQGRVTELATTIRNGGVTTSGIDWQSEEGKTVYQALLNDPTMINGLGGKEYVRAEGSNYNIWSNLERAYNEGVPLIYGGRVAIVTGVSRVTGGGANKSKYQITFLDNNETTTSIT